MKLFVVLLVLRLTAAEKLNRRYLPPPGAKLSGGRSDDLQTPLEYPIETPTYDTSEYRSTVKDTDYVEIGTPAENELSMVTNGHYYESLSHLRSSFDPGHMPIIAVPESIGQNYQPHLYGMYGGNSMSIKHFDNNIEVAGSDDLITSNINNKNPHADQYITTTPRPNKGIVTTSESIGENLYFKKFESPQANADKSAIVLNYENVQNPDGYFYNFETSNGIHRDESASTAKGVKVKGFYSYKGDDGKVYTVTYTADENGFQPNGDHLPPISEAIQNVIEQAKRSKDAGDIDDGSYDEAKYGHMKYQGPVHRYMQKNAKTHTRKKISSEQKILPSKIIKYETNNIVKSIQNSQVKQDKILKPFGKTIFQQLNNSRIDQNAMYIQSPKTKENKGYISNSQKVNNNKVVSNGMVLQNIQRNRGIPSSKKEKAFEKSIQDGYFYVPPENVFVDGKYHGKLFTDTKLNSKSVLKKEFNTDDQRNENHNFTDKDLPQITKFITFTDKPFYQQTYDGDFYASTNSDVEQSIDNTKATLKGSPDKKSDTETTKQLYSTILSTKPYDKEFTKEIFQEKETVIPEHRIETDFLSSKNGLDTANYQSTTPMPSEEKYKTQNTNEYETTLSESALNSSNSDVDYFENGYFETTPEKSETFEDFSSSTYNPSIYYTAQGIFSTESSPNDKVDEFGRTLQDSFGYFTGSSINSFTNEMEYEIEPKASTPYNNYEETFGADKPTILDEQSITKFSNEFGSDANNTRDDLHRGKDAIIGEDFRGPKQPQRYDPKQGYYY